MLEGSASADAEGPARDSTQHGRTWPVGAASFGRPNANGVVVISGEARGILRGHTKTIPAECGGPTANSIVGPRLSKPWSSRVGDIFWPLASISATDVEIRQRPDPGRERQAPPVQPSPSQRPRTLDPPHHSPNRAYHRTTSQAIRRAPHAQPTTIVRMKVAHRRPQIRMTQQLLHRPDVRARLQQMRRERMAQRMARHTLR